MLLKFHRGIEGANQAVFHDTYQSDWSLSNPAEMSLDWRGSRVGWQLKRFQLRLRRDLLIKGSTRGASLVSSWSGHGVLFSIRGDHEDRHFAQFAKDVGNLVVLAIVPPDHPDPPARWRLCEHLVGAVLAFLEPEDAIKCGLDLLRCERVSIDLL
jgi:hypothetical protein